MSRLEEMYNELEVLKNLKFVSVDIIKAASEYLKKEIYAEQFRR